MASLIGGGQKVQKAAVSQQTQVATRAATQPSAANNTALAEEEQRQKALTNQRRGRQGLIATSARGDTSGSNVWGAMNGWSTAALKTRLGE